MMSELVAVKIKGTVVTARYGTLKSGDILRTDRAFAEHLVEQCGAGEYHDAVKEKAKAEAVEKATAGFEKAAKAEAEAKAKAEAGNKK